MTSPEEIKEFIRGGEWVSIATEIRPSAAKTTSGAPQPFYCSRRFVYSAPDAFECTVMNYADANGRMPLVRIIIKGHNVWGDEHPITSGAYNLDYVADAAYEVTPVHRGFADAANKFPAAGLSRWEANVTQDVRGKVFPMFGLTEGQVYTDYDLIYIYEGMLFNGSKNVDGRPFDKPENRPTNLQVPLIRKR